MSSKKCLPHCECRRHFPYAKTHGFTGTREHIVWKHIRQRCNNPNDKSYPDYGGRGITVCERWDDFTLFLEDMGERPTPQHTIERRDTDGDYCPENCYWAADRFIQNNNTRKNVFLTFEGRRLTIAQWAAEKGIEKDVLYKRRRRGWSVEDTLTLPVNMIASRHSRQALKEPVLASGSLVTR